MKAFIAFMAVGVDWSVHSNPSTLGKVLPKASIKGIKFEPFILNVLGRAWPALYPFLSYLYNGEL